MVDGIAVFSVGSQLLPEIEAGIRASHRFNLEAPAEEHAAYTLHTVAVFNVLRGIVRKAFLDDPGRRLTLLDVGGGRGELAYLFADEFDTAMIDVDLYSARVARKLQHEGRQFHVLCGDCSSLPLAPQSVDVVVTKETAHHMPDPAAFFAGIARVVKPGGIALVVEGVHRLTVNWRKAAARDRMRQLGATHHHFRLANLRRLLSEAFEHADIAWAQPDLPRLLATRLAGGSESLKGAAERFLDRLPELGIVVLSLGGGSVVWVCRGPLCRSASAHAAPRRVAEYPFQLADVEPMPAGSVDAIRACLASAR